MRSLVRIPLAHFPGLASSFSHDGGRFRWLLVAVAAHLFVRMVTALTLLELDTVDEAPMRRSELMLSSLRRARFESFEERLALSAQPVAPLPQDPAALQRVEQQAGDVSTAANEIHFTTGVNYVRDNFGFQGRGQTVVVIDSGIAYDHFALGRGYGPGARVVGGWDFTENDANPYDDGPAGYHGTHVAGIIGSSDPNYRGVASEVDLVALRVFDDQGNGYFNLVENALRWVHAHRNDFRNPITTVNLSLGMSWNANNVPNWANLEEEFAQLKADGIFISVSAGNAFASYNATGLSYPAASSYVVPVSSLDSNGQFSSYSQRNSRVIAAPGRNIYSTVPDYFYGADGNPNDFAASSGTSMASPYVAGAAVLIRQAMQFVGMVNINQDTIYNVMRATADSVYDSVTNATYSKLNVQRALDSIMPADDYGSTMATASSLGTLAGNRTVTGIIGRAGDQDYFTFTAGMTGKLKLSATASDMATAWQRTAAGGVIAGNDMTLDVVAGRTYTVGLSSSTGLGHYSISAAFQGMQIQTGITNGDRVQVSWQDSSGATAYHVVLRDMTTGRVLQNGWNYHRGLKQVLSEGTYTISVAAPGQAYTNLTFNVPQNRVHPEASLLNANGGVQVAWRTLPGVSAYYVVVQSENSGVVSQGWQYGTSARLQLTPGSYTVLVAASGHSLEGVAVTVPGPNVLGPMTQATEVVRTTEPAVAMSCQSFVTTTAALQSQNVQPAMSHVSETSHFFTSSVTPATPAVANLTHRAEQEQAARRAALIIGTETDHFHGRPQGLDSHAEMTAVDDFFSVLGVAAHERAS